MPISKLSTLIGGIIVLHLVCGSVPAAAANKICFVTSVTGPGNLSSWPDAGGSVGLGAADAICQSRATAAGLANPDDFVAWLSDSNDDAYCRVQGFSGRKVSNCGQPTLPQSGGPWVRTDGFPIGDTISHLLSPEGAILVPLSIDEFGSGDLDPPGSYFTNTNSDGEFYSSFTSCGDWTTSDSISVRGGDSIGTTFAWTSGVTTTCDQLNGLLCMEKGAGDPMPAITSSGARVFVTSTNGSGDLASWADAGGQVGVAAGDAICQARAAAAVLAAPSSFRAWLSTDGTDAIDRFDYDGPWIRLDGVPIADGKTDLSDGELFSALNLTETGVYLAFLPTWTGTDAVGTTSGSNCDGWTDGTNGFVARTGLANLTSNDWTERGHSSCDSSSKRLYCFSQIEVLFADGFESGNLDAWQ